MKEKLLKFLENIFGESHKVSENEYIFYCPFCNHYKKKLQLNTLNLFKPSFLLYFLKGDFVEPAFFFLLNTYSG